MEQKKISCLSHKLKSHPDKFLEDHLLSVGDHCREIISSKKLNLGIYLDSGILRDISYLIGITHDFGKATSYFQSYINEDDETRKIELKNKSETNHGLISAIFTYYVIKKYLSDKNFTDKKHYQYLPVISFMAVKRHHGNLDNADDEIIDFEGEILEKQIKAIDFDAINKIYKTLLAKIISDFDCNLVKDNILTDEHVNRGQSTGCRKLFEGDFKRERKLIRDLDESPTLFFYFTTLLMYSALLDADKTDAAELKKIERVCIDENIVDKYMMIAFENKENKNNRINLIRNEIYNEVVSKAANISLEKDKILSLNVPTGTGKTLTSLSFALKLRNRIEREKSYSPRIIYALPFLSIIDQNFKVFENVLKTVNGKEPTTDILLKHHHLSDITYVTRDDEFENTESNIDKDLLLIEGWNSEVIVTTFMQFFYSLISNKNRAIRKFHNITNSIIILDEVQAIPHKYWFLLNRTIKFFANHFNVYFIFVTATQPLIFDEKAGEIQPLVKNKEKYFEELDRVTLKVSLEPLCLDDLKNILKEDILRNPDKDFLIVLNTIKSSKKIYDFIYDFIDTLKLEQTELYYLSTNIVPKERLKRIEDITEKNKKRRIIVSTQLIEAGVDISVDIAYRDFGPFDSINQIAGRCNRNFGDKKGIVNIFILKEENNGRVYFPHIIIYESFIIDKSKKTLIDKGDRINEPKFLELSKDYFDKINSGKSDDFSNKILCDVEELKFDDLSGFKLIEEKHYKIDVFVEVDRDAQEVWQKYQILILDKTIAPLERRKEFLKIKKQFYDFVISIQGKFKNELTCFDDKCDLGYISKDDLEQLYSLKTGFEMNYDVNGGTLIT